MVEKKSTNKKKVETQKQSSNKKNNKIETKAVKKPVHKNEVKKTVDKSKSKESNKKANSFFEKVKLFLKENHIYILYGVIVILFVLLMYVSLNNSQTDIDNSDSDSDSITEEVTFYYIRSPKDCTYCSDSYLDMVLETHKQIFLEFENLKVNNVVYEYDSKEAEALIEDYSVERVPAVLLEAKENNTAFNNIEGYESYFEKEAEGKYRLLDVILSGNDQEMLYELDDTKRAEIEEEYEQMQAMAKELLGESDKPKIDFFVMSFCPYGIQAETGILEALELLGNEVDYKPWFIVSSTKENSDRCKLIDNLYYCSLHGPRELEENIRQLCIYEDQEDKFLGYITEIKDQYNAGLLNSDNIDSEWESIAQKTGVDIASVKECYNDENRVSQMLDDQIAVSTYMKVSGSPTIYVDGVLASDGRSGEYYKTTLCNGFSSSEKPDVCDVSLGESTSTPAGSC